MDLLAAPDVVELVGRSEAHHTLAGEVHGDHLDGQPPLHMLCGQALALSLPPPHCAPGREASSSRLWTPTVWLGRGGGGSSGGVAPGGPGPGPLRASSPDHHTR